MADSFIENVNRVSAWIQGLPYDGQNADTIVTIAFVTTLPSTGTLGDMCYLSTTGVLYIWDGSSWESITAQGGGIQIVDTLPLSSTIGALVYLTTDNKLHVYNGTAWNEVGNSTTIESTGGSITVVGTKPVSATLGDIIYLTTDGFLYTWDGLEWDKVGGTTTTNGGITLEDPDNPQIGDIKLNILDGSVGTWDGTQWVIEEYTPHASSMTSIKFVTALPLVADSKDGDLVYNETDGITYIFKNGAWVNLLQDLTPNASGTGIEIVAILPLTVTNGKVLYNSANKKLYEGVNGVWIPVVEATTAATDVADASITVAKFAAGINPVETLSVLPQTGNSVGRMVYLTTDGQLYRYTASGFTTAVPAQAITGTIGATQIADDAITTPKIAAGAITADEIGANAITAGKIAVGAVTAGTIKAGAISATEIASNAITTDKIYSGAITAIKLSANSVDATKIVAGSITASLIGADAINAGHIQAGVIGASEISAGAITADKIASKSITASQIQAGAISASEIASNAITASHILAGAITASKLSVDALDGKSGAFSGSRAYASNGSWTLSCTNTVSGASNGGIHSQGSGYGIVGRATAGIGALGYSLSGTGVKGQGTTWGVYGETLESAGMWGMITYQKAYAGGGFSPFTGSHITYAKDKKLKVGMVVSSLDAWCINIDQTLIHIEKSKLKAKNVLGVVSYVKTTLLDNITNNPMIKEEHKPYIDYMTDNGFFEVEINSLGEGGILVSNANGNIENGDYLVSDGKGYAMKQDDDLLHNYTVAKALESVDWSIETTTSKMIACTYHAG